LVTATEVGNGMKAIVPVDEAKAFASLMQTSQYRQDERDYKWAVHLVLSRLLSRDGRDDLPTLIADLFGQAMPDLDRIGIAPDDQTFIRSAVPGPGGLRGAIANLAGGRWGIAQFIWIPRAVDFGLGAQMADAFMQLVQPEPPVAQRVDAFRDQLYAASQELRTKGGFEPGWGLRRVSLAFVAVILAGFDPTTYTFYSSSALHFGYGRYAQELDWPKGTVGAIYAEVCEFVRGVGHALSDSGVPIRDLIDAQSFIWIGYWNSNKPNQSEQTKSSSSSKKPQVTPPLLNLEVIAVELAKTVYWPSDRALQLVKLVDRWGQILFQGPPGTGKTFVAERLARLFCQEEEDRLEIVQFHPSYAYEDFVEGIRPVVNEGSNLTYEVRKGIFLKLVELAETAPEEKFFIMIDELNRANLPRVFGELLYALEYRGAEHTFRLPYSGDEAYVPRNITFIGTMNTADRSIALVDAAIRRRFRHVSFAPDTNVLKSWLGDHELADMADLAAGRLVSLNHQLDEVPGADRLVGHTYLMRGDLREIGLVGVWEEDIAPVLNEHLFNQPHELNRLRDVFLLGSA